ncbi:carbon-phosphorus lyase [Rubrobacter tropicus]|uniref:Carbon-phosphorus lyase n=1 Tax=Rubrobacter tropicus TaxID=2653851 RepID=A0A6G8Q4G1_9ACTN|nr:carbon-phosphorus lyase complex subunit PhnI [Rubrobacter tropicus]QIN81328.1 carbon-phosphorus lyase [Rubrobacter tropicus]
MAYTAVKGGEEAIKAAEKLEHASVEGSGLTPEAVLRGMRYAVDQVMGEAGLYAPRLAARAVVQAQGDLAEAAFLLRAYRSTLPREGYTVPADTDDARLVRRVSSAFKDVPGGQVLGPTRDYSQRLLGLKREEEPSGNGAGDVGGEGNLPRVTDVLREAGLVAKRKPEETGEPFDLTREALTVPAPRSGRLQSLARGEAGAMTALAYSSLRGFGAVHPTLAEFRVGYLPLQVEHPVLGEKVEIGEVLCTEVEAVGREMGYGGEDHDGEKAMSLGYGLVFGRNERKGIAMAVLDAAIRAGGEREQGPAGPAEDEEFVLYHADGIEGTGFVEHLKLPHYVTFQSSLDRLREVQRRGNDVDG